MAMMNEMEYRTIGSALAGHLAPSQFEAMFLSTAHTDEVIDETLEAMRGALGDL